jgi:predicted PurR-regulated permease PerM
LILAGVLISIYFYGVAGIFQRNFKWSPKLSIIISVLMNVVLLIAIAWFVGASLQQQATRLADTLPETIQNAKAQIGKSALGRKLIEQLNTSGDSVKTLSVVKRFFSSGFGILSDLYIVLLLGTFFIASPALYKKGIVRLLPSKAQKKGADIIGKISLVLKKWLKGQLIGIIFIGVLTAIGLIILGMPMVLALSIIAGVLNFIPNFGPLIALIPAVLISLMQGAGYSINNCLYVHIHTNHSKRNRAANDTEKND